ncbi:MAG: Fatty acid desaturase [Actinomycetia bacterium]|nr:Fatty acid desaturase [Actinomycetes bacterium]
MPAADVAELVATNGMTRPSARESTTRFAVAVATYVSAGALASAVGGWPARAGAWGLQALVLTGLYSAMHEAAHRHLYRARWADRLAGVACASAILVDFSLYRAFHLRHHVTTATADDPEPKADLRSVGGYLAVVAAAGPAFVVGLLVDAARAVAGHPPRYVRTDGQRSAVRVDAVALVAALGVAVGGLVVAPGAVLRWWLVPLAITYSVPFILTALPEHHGCDIDPDPLANTRTVVSNPVFRFLYWNNNFHAEHHLAPSVAYHRLPELHRDLAGCHGHLSRSYLGFHRDLLRTLRGTR